MGGSPVQPENFRAVPVEMLRFFPDPFKPDRFFLVQPENIQAVPSGYSGSGSPQNRVPIPVFDYIFVQDLINIVSYCKSCDVWKKFRVWIKTFNFDHTTKVGITIFLDLKIGINFDGHRRVQAGTGTVPVQSADRDETVRVQRRAVPFPTNSVKIMLNTQLMNFKTASNVLCVSNPT